MKYSGPLRPSGRTARVGSGQYDALSRLLGSGQSLRYSGRLVLWSARASVAAEHLLGVYSVVRLLCATGASYLAPGRTGVWGRGACHGSHAAFYAGGQSYLWCADPAGQRYAADRPFGKATAAHSTRSRVCYLRSVVCSYPQCLGRLSGFWLPQTLYANCVTAYFGFYPWWFYSTDYFALLPWLFLFWAGYFLYDVVGRQRMEPLRRSVCPPLGWLGRHSLLLYLLHQPVIYGVLLVVFRVLGG